LSKTFSPSVLVPARDSRLSFEKRMPAETTIASARAFVRSLNVLLKFSRLYGLEHSRSAGQLDATWAELQAALGAGGDAGLLLGTSGSQLLLDGVPLESTPAERSFAALLNNAGVASVNFASGLTRDEFARFVRVFANAGGKTTGLIEQLKAALAEGGQSSIRVNEVRFVAEDAEFADARVAAQLTARSLGIEGPKLQEWLRSPEKLIQLIVAAEGANRGSGGSEPGSSAGTGTETDRGTEAGLPLSGAPAQRHRNEPLEEEDILRVFRLLTQLGEAGRDPSAPSDPAAWKQKLAELPQPAQVTLRDALAALAASAPASRPDTPALVRLAEDLAIRFALDRYEHGEVRVNAVRQLMERMGREVESLRKLLEAREEKLSHAGVTVESRTDILDRQFWAVVPTSGKRSVLMSPEAWCIPPRNVRQFVEELREGGEQATADSILSQYAACIRNDDLEARRRVSIGVAQLADLYGSAIPNALEAAIRDLGAQMEEEREPELQTLLSAAFVRLTQEASSHRSYAAIQQALDSLANVERSRPTWVQGLRPRIGVENHLPDLVEEAVAAPYVPGGFVEMLRRLPEAAAEHLAARLARCVRRRERERLVEIARRLGPPSVAHLREVFRVHPGTKVIGALGLLSRLDPAAVAESLPQRLREGQRPLHDAVVRQLDVAAATERGRLLLDVLELLDPLVQPMALDEIGMSGDPQLAPGLLRVAEGELPAAAEPYARVKAIEALGRLRSAPATEALRKFVEARQAFHWSYPKELRIAAAQALEKIDPEWAQKFVPRLGLDTPELAVVPLDSAPDGEFARWRRYRRIHVSRPVTAVVSVPQGKYTGRVKVISLEGCLVVGDFQIPVGTGATLKISSGLRSFVVQVIARNVRSQQAGFEAIGMELEDRSRLRRLIASLIESPSAAEALVAPA
jgi:hypothetical protein